MRSTFRPALILIAGRVLGFAVSFCLPIILVRIFDQAEFGTYRQLFLIYGTLFGIAQLGMAESLFYFLPRAVRDGGSYVVNSTLALAAAGLACLVLLTSAGETIAGWMSNPGLVPVIPLLGLFALLTLMSSGLEIAMTSRNRYGLAAASYACSDFARATLCVLPVLLVPKLEWLLIGAIAFASLRLCAMVWYVWQEFDGALRPDLGLLKHQLTYALPFELAVLVEIAQANFHQYAVSYYFDAATFAIYSVGCLQLPLVDLVASSTANVMMVRMAEELRGKRDHMVITMWHDTIRKLALIFVPLVGVLLVTARDLIVLLFTDAYLASVPIFMVWSSAIVLAAVPMDGLLRVYAQTRFLLALNVIRLLMIAACLHWFLSVLQLVGAVLVTVLASAIGKGLGMVRMKRLWQVGLRDLLPWRNLLEIGAVAAAAGLATVIVSSSLEVAALLRLAITSLVYTASYLGMAFGFGLVRESEWALIADWFRRPRIMGSSRPQDLQES